MYVTIRMLANREGCSDGTIRHVLAEMKATGNYPTAVRRCGKVTVDTEQFDHYVCRRERKS